MPLQRLLLTLLALVALGSAPLAAQDFYGYPCTQDCSGHEAGYEWAKRKGIDDVDDCGGNSTSFIEGCQAYVEEDTGGQDDPAAVDQDVDDRPEE
jgi:hypothetical protein